jgi:hypothetical protein
MGFNVVEFPQPRSPEDALEEAVNMARNGDLQDVLVLCYDGDGHQVMIASGAVTRRDALWMLETAKVAVLSPDEDDENAA